METVLITGANRGIGLGLVKRFIEGGAHVHACARTPAAATELIALAGRHRGRITLHPLDAASAASVAHLQTELGPLPLDILINNAGIYGGGHQAPGDFDFDEWERVLAVNTVGPARVLDALTANLDKGKSKKAVAITSGMGSTARHDGANFAYRSSKAALNNAMKGFAIALKPKGITVALFHPGWVRTDMGGSNASLSIDESSRALHKQIANLKSSDSGRFLSYDGQEIAW